MLEAGGRFVGRFRHMVLPIFEGSLTNEFKDFIKYNFIYWRNIHGRKENGFVLIEGFHGQLKYLLRSARIAKVIEKEKKCVPIVLTSHYSQKVKFYESYNINNFIFLNRKLLNVFLILKALWHTLIFLLKFPNGEDLLRLTYRGINIGPFVYDAIIRQRSGLFTIDKVKISYLDDILESFFLTDCYYSYFAKYSIKYLIISHHIYTNYGILSQVAFKKDARIINAYYLNNHTKIMKELKKTTVSPRTPPKNEIEDILVNYNEDIENTVKRYLAKHFKGNLDLFGAIEAYKGKRKYNKREFMNILGIKNNHPCVFICPHAFSDGPHGTQKILFKDHYDWFEETIKKIAQKHDVNWFIKPHPYAKMHNEEGIVEDYIENYKNKNIFLVPQDFSTYSLTNIADAIITVHGTVGLEFSCCGIPVITCGKTYYTGWGFTIEPESKDEYFKLLENIEDVNKLSDEQIKYAKTIMYYLIKHEFHDVFNSNVYFYPGESTITMLKLFIARHLPSKNRYFRSGDINEKRRKEIAKAFKEVNTKLKNYRYNDDPIVNRVKQII